MHRMIQLSFADTYEKCANLFEDRKPEYIKGLTNINSIEYYLCLLSEKNYNRFRAMTRHLYFRCHIKASRRRFVRRLPASHRIVCIRGKCSFPSC